ncbi:cytochrome b/b6 domain-containing protein [Rhodovarius crocodyli]|uniref:Cytochrome b/b6 domain-containing protein n=1 Tax=Rhodovarius crocodyli TaxID=1979269 RepID=A0A437M3H0_9PROT|nr:cytochrome b/b6 domain-containing protein [Rhodovarius crocodyli]RVT92136.1 cytochrome b/b6 domain-containing protein [Rhodovarius crocodyli]
MTAMDAARPPRTRRLHPLPVRILHWINAATMIVMILSGFGIYNDEAILDWVFFPHWLLLGSWAAEHLLWHLAGMWLLVLNGAAYLAYGLISGRFRERFLPISAREVLATVRDTLRLRLSHQDITVYNAVQKLLYIGVILAIIVQVATGLAIWKPVQLAWLTALFGGFQGARLAHFIGMACIVGFLLVHVALALLVPRTILAMVLGGPRIPPQPAE